MSVDPDPQLAFVFPGQGSQSIGMLAELAEVHPIVRETFEEASDGAGVDLWALSQSGAEVMLNRTEYTQPALLAAGIAVWRVWRDQGGTAPQLLAGHSLGEYTALVAAEAIELHDAAHLVRIRGQAMQDAAPPGVGAMAAILGIDDATVESVCREVTTDQLVVPANYNSPGQVVIGGHVRAVDAAIAELSARGARKTVKLSVSVPSHTPLMREAANRVAEAMSAYRWREPEIPVIQNVDAQVHIGVAQVREALTRQLYLPVRWSDCVRTMHDAGIRRTAECGPGKVLTGLIKRSARDIDGRTIGSPGELDAALGEWRH
ncbi:MAG: ACP S-malonyltransferase [Rhodanobacteraceae bacterium]